MPNSAAIRGRIRDAALRSESNAPGKVPLTQGVIADRERGSGDNGTVVGPEPRCRMLNDRRPFIPAGDAPHVTSVNQRVFGIFSLVLFSPL